MSAGAAAGAAGAAATAAIKPFVYMRSPYWNHLRKQRAASKLHVRNLARARGATDHRGDPIFTPQTWHIHKGDLVQVTQTVAVRDTKNWPKLLKVNGKTKSMPYLNKQGKVLRVFRDKDTIIVQGINMKTRVAQPNESGTGYFYSAESPIPYAHVTLVHPTSGRPIEGGIRRASREEQDAGMHRTSRLTKVDNVLIPRSEPLKRERITNSLTDTLPADMIEVTYVKPSYAKPVIRRTAEGKIVMEQVGEKEDNTLRIVIEPELLEARAARISY